MNITHRLFGNFFLRMQAVVLAMFTMIVGTSASPVVLGDAVHTTDLNTLFPVLGGELSNSAVTSVDDIREVMPRMKAAGLNTVLVPVYWEFLEPEEGKFDYTLLDAVVDEARKNSLKVGLLWFGAWKNSMSCYAPLWFKQDVKRFPRAMTMERKPLEIASCFSENVWQADARAFTAMLDRLDKTDAGMQVVSIIQIENEIGMLEDARDHSAVADRLFAGTVPQELIKYLKKHRKTLHGQLAAKWQANGDKSVGSWAEVFGNDIYTDEIFMAWHYGVYVERLAKIARSKSNRMLYVNAAMNSRGRKPGEYPSAGPLAHLKDIWHAAAPSLDMLAPDIYDTGFSDWCKLYALPDNRLFIPESRCCVNSGVRALYAFGEHDALGFSPFAIDQAAPHEVAAVTEAYSMMNQLIPIYNTCARKNGSWGMLFDGDVRERTIVDGDARLVCRHFFTLPWDARATDGSVWPEGGGMIIKLAKDEYIIAGNGVVVEFATDYEMQYKQNMIECKAVQQLGEDGFLLAGGNDGSNDRAKPAFNGKRMGIGFVDEVKIGTDGNIIYQRRHNGDQDHQGRHARISVGDWKILHVKLYRY